MIYIILSAHYKLIGYEKMSEQPVEYIIKPQLKNGPECVTIDEERKVKIFAQLVRHLTAIIYLIAELVLGRYPGKL